MNKEGEVLLGSQMNEAPSHRTQFLTKTLRSPFEEFAKRVQQNIKGIVPQDASKILPSIQFGDSQNLPLPDRTVDLIVTSPPYASNAIDYMRAHKFSLVWFGYTVADLGERRGKYIGGEAVKDNVLEPLPPKVAEVVTAMTDVDRRKGIILHRYYAEMTRALREMFRVLKSEKAAIVVVGSSVMRGKDTETAECLAAIGRAVGFEVPHIGVRQLDRNRRMLPASTNRNLTSQIQNRMHEEYVIGFYKP
jgi:DNA modification methylase